MKINREKNFAQYTYFLSCEVEIMLIVIEVYILFFPFNEPGCNCYCILIDILCAIFYNSLQWRYWLNFVDSSEWCIHWKARAGPFLHIYLKLCLVNIILLLYLISSTSTMRVLLKSFAQPTWQRSQICEYLSNDLNFVQKRIITYVFQLPHYHKRLIAKLRQVRK